MITTTALSLFERNLSALARRSPELAQRLRFEPPRTDLEFLSTLDSALSAQLGSGPTARGVASRRRPLAEATIVAGELDVPTAAVAVVTGFGLGHHVKALAEKMGAAGCIVVYEPDVGLLRAVLERVDHADWLERLNVAILTDASDRGAMAGVMRGSEGLVALGVKLIEHAPSRERIGARAEEFSKTFIEVIDGIRLTLVTTLVQVRTTLRNVLQNLDAYVSCAGVADLKDILRGKPAVVVSAGPSLARNLHLLAQPGVRERVCIIAAQTVLRPMLSAGIRPHFVTALDYSEIGRRFYEGLTPALVRGITLVVEAKVNAAVLEAWPGAVRVIADDTADLILDKAMREPVRGEADRVRPGATVAHLAYYLARHLGCDPVALVGQDLGFTDGQYYAAGAAIHSVWAPELGAFNTLEMMEWQRVARMGPALRRTVDHHNQPIYTDEQMLSYLHQFEESFMLDARQGLTTIDATEGGVRKRYADPMPLGSFLDGPASGVTSIEFPETPERTTARMDALQQRLRMVRSQATDIAKHSRSVATMLAELLEHHADQARVNRIITRIEHVRDQVERLEPGYALVQALGQCNVLNRTRTDRALMLETDLSPLEEQRRRAQRDIENVRAIARSADQLASMLDDALVAARTGRHVTHDLPKPTLDEAATSSEPTTPTKAVVDAVIFIDFDHDGLGGPRDLSHPFAGEPSVLCATVRRVLKARTLRHVVLVSSDETRTKTLLGPLASDPRVRHERAADVDAERVRAVRAARRLAPEAWRAGAGLANLTCYDELFDPSTLLEMLTRTDAEAALLVGPDWCAVDPELCDRLVEQYRLDPVKHRMPFTMAAPGLAPCVVARSLCADIGRPETVHSPLASAGGLLGYVPGAPALDLIGSPNLCVNVPVSVRDAGVRAIADAAGSQALERAIMAAGGLMGARATELAETLASHQQSAFPTLAPTRVVVGHAEPAEHASLSHAAASVRLCPLIEALAPWLGALGSPHHTLTLGDQSFDAASASDLIAALECARALGGQGLGLVVRVRESDATSTLDPAHLVDPRTGVDAIMVDVTSAMERIGPDAPLGPACPWLSALIDARTQRCGRSGLVSPWIVPVLVRSDRTAHLVESFVEQCARSLGAWVVEPLCAPDTAARLTPLPVPKARAQRAWRSTLLVQPDGSVPVGRHAEGHAQLGTLIGPRATPLAELWQRVLLERSVLASRLGDEHACLRIEG